MDFHEINNVNLNKVGKKVQKDKPAVEKKELQQRKKLKETPNSPSYWQNVIGVKNSAVSFSGNSQIDNEFIDKQIANIKRTCYWGEDARTNDSFHRQALLELYPLGKKCVEKYAQAASLGLQYIYQEEPIKKYNELLLDIFRKVPDIQNYDEDTLSYILCDIVNSESSDEDVDKYAGILIGILGCSNGTPAEKLMWLRQKITNEYIDEYPQILSIEEVFDSLNTYVELCKFISDEDCKKNIIKSKLTVEDEKNLIKLLKDDNIPTDGFIDFIGNNIEPKWWEQNPEKDLVNVVNEILADDRKKNLFAKLIDKKTSSVPFGAVSIQEIFCGDVEFATNAIEYIHSRRIEENTHVSTSFVNILDFFDYIDASNFEDFKEFSKQESIERAIQNIAIYENPLTGLFDKSIYDKEQEFKAKGISEFNALALAGACIEIQTGKHSKIAQDVIEIFFPSNDTGFRSKITAIKNKLGTPSKISTYNSEWYIVDIINSLKNNDGKFEEKNQKFLYSLIRANRKEHNGKILDFESILSIIRSVKNEKGVVDSQKAVKAMNILIKTKEYSSTANILESLMSFPENKRENILQICKSIYPNEKKSLLNLKVIAEYCFDKEGNLDESKLEFVKKLVLSNEMVYNGSFFKLCNQYPQLRDFYAQIASNVYIPIALSPLGYITGEYLNDDGTIDEKIQNDILKYVKNTKTLYGFGNLYDACYQQVNGEEPVFDRELFDRTIKLMGYERQLSTNMSVGHIDSKIYVDILKQELFVSDIKFSEKVTLLNSLKKIRDYVPQIDSEELACLNKAISDIEASLTLENISLPVDETTKADFIKNVLTSKTSSTELTEFETTIIDSIPKLEEMTNGICLSYPRKNFLEDLSQICDTDEKLQILSEKTGMYPIFDEEEAKTITGYNGIIKLNELDQNNPVEKEIYDCLYNFMYNNEVNTGDEKLDRQLNYIIKAFPEFINTVGKKQHGTQKYTVDVHSLLVLAYSIQNSDYLNNLNAVDRSLLKISAIFHDLMKQENIVDKGHQIQSSLYARSIVKKLIQNPETQDRIYELIDNHHWTEEYSYAADRNKKSKELAFRFRRPNDFEIAKIMARSDLKAVNTGFYERLKGCLDESNLEPIQQNLDYLYSTGSAVFSDKISKHANLDNCIQIKDGVEYKVINLHKISDATDMGEFGFEKGKKKKDLKLLAHMVEQLGIYENLNTIKLLSSPLNGGVLSESLITPEYKRTYCSRKYGVLLSEINTNIINAASSNQGSGTQKDFSNIIELIYNGYGASFRTNFKEGLLKNLGIPKYSVTDEEYAQFYKKVIASKTSLSEINRTKEYNLGKYTITGEQLYYAINKFQSDLIDKNEKRHNEIVGYTPKISAVIAKATSLNALPDGLLKFAHENNLPIVLI